MPEPWYPGAIRRPGVNAGYNSGSSKMQVCVRHYTVGRDSTAIGDRGYFQWLISRDGTVTQFAEANAVCWHAGEWNGMGPGIENEYLDEDVILSPEQIAAAKGLVEWLSAEWAIPLDEYRGPRIPTSTGFSGFLDHRSLQQSEQHTDYWPIEAWAQIVLPPAPPPVPKIGSEQRMIEVQVDAGTDHSSLFIFDGTTAWGLPSVAAVPAPPLSRVQLSGAQWDNWKTKGKITVVS